jgi:hypothetical protein
LRGNRCPWDRYRSTEVALWSYGLAIALSRERQDRCQDHVFTASATMPSAASNGIMTMACCEQDGVATWRSSGRKRTARDFEIGISVERRIGRTQDFHQLQPPAYNSTFLYTRHECQHVTIALKRASNLLVGYEGTLITQHHLHTSTQPHVIELSPFSHTLTPKVRGNFYCRAEKNRASIPAIILQYACIYI